MEDNRSCEEYEFVGEGVLDGVSASWLCMPLSRKKKKKGIQKIDKITMRTPIESPHKVQCK